MIFGEDHNLIFSSFIEYCEWKLADENTSQVQIYDQIVVRGFNDSLQSFLNAKN